MKKLSASIMRSPLFKGLTEDEIFSVLSCFDAHTRSYEKGSFIYRRGDVVTALGIVESGSIHVLEEDFWGNRNIVNNVVAGQLFAETYACIKDQSLHIDVLAVEATVVLFVDVQRVLTVCSSACEFHTRLARNLVFILAQKNLFVTEKLGLLTKRTLRHKILAYLSAEEAKCGSPEFDIPFNRQELADFLAVDRSALSKELGNLSKAGIVSFRKNHFILHYQPDQMLISKS